MKATERTRWDGPVISPVPSNTVRPYWSVMIPVCNRLTYLRQALESVLAQDPGPERMQICIVDNSTEIIDWCSWLTQGEAARVEIFRQPLHVTMSENWNTCIERACGQWVHILHWDDYVLPGFYQRLAQAAECHPEVSLLAARSFFIDAEGVITWVTPRLCELENGGRKVDDFFYSTPLQCPGVVVRRTVYESLGGFRSDLKFTLDCEMWARIIGTAGGLVTSEVLACYRMSEHNESSRLGRTAEGLYDHNRLHQIFAERYPGFDCKKATQRVCNMALGQAERFSKTGDSKAAQANMDFWKQHAPAKLRLRKFVGKIARKVF